MSRLGKKEIQLPEGIKFSADGFDISITGPKGTITRQFLPEVTIEEKDGLIRLNPTKKTKIARALWGTYASLIVGMIEGVTNGFEKKLVIEGVGYKAEMKGNMIVMQLGFSHPVEVPIPEGITISIEKNIITVAGIEKDRVGQFAAEIRAKKKPEPFKGKGIRYIDEVIRRKQGKRAVGG